MLGMVPGARDAVGSKTAPALLGLPVEWYGKIKRASKERIYIKGLPLSLITVRP